MSSTLGGDDPQHDLPPEKKDQQEKRLRKEGRKLQGQGKPREAKKKLDRANEISRATSKKAQHH
jgi:hypothetical protein